MGILVPYIISTDTVVGIALLFNSKYWLSTRFSLSIPQMGEGGLLGSSLLSGGGISRGYPCTQDSTEKDDLLAANGDECADSYLAFITSIWLGCWSKCDSFARVDSKYPHLAFADVVRGRTTGVSVVCLAAVDRLLLKSFLVY